MSNGDIDGCFKVRLGGCQYEYTRTYPVPQDGDDVFLKFYVKALKHAHIILSPSTEPSKRDDQAYEIILGVPNNGNGTILRNIRGKDSNNQVIIDESSPLSPTEWRFFWIRVKPNGYFQIGKALDSAPFLEWKDDNFKPIKHIGLASWDCPTEWALDWEI